MKNIYLSGKINGLDLNVAKNNFKLASEKVKLFYNNEKNEEVKIVNMMTVPSVKMDWADYLIRDMIFLKNCDVIAFMFNWENSHGAKVEKAFAEGLGLEMIYLDENFNVIN